MCLDAKDKQCSSFQLFLQDSTHALMIEDSLHNCCPEDYSATTEAMLAALHPLDKANICHKNIKKLLLCSTSLSPFYFYLESYPHFSLPSVPSKKMHTYTCQGIASTVQTRLAHRRGTKHKTSESLQTSDLPGLPGPAKDKISAGNEQNVQRTC